MATVAGGPGKLSGNSTCRFQAGRCIFTNLGVDTMGENYTLQFQLINPSTADVTLAVSQVNMLFYIYN